MRISRRTSGGRGEYEISEESARGLTPTDLIGQQFIVRIALGLRFNTLITLTAQGGKRRLRRMPPAKGLQLPRQLAAALMMPDPVRENRALGVGEPVLQAQRYAFEHIPVEPTLTGANAVLDVDRVILANGSNLAEEISLVDRLARVRQVWSSADSFPEPIRSLLTRHRALVEAGDPIGEDCVEIVRHLSRELAERSADVGIFYTAQADVLEGLKEALEFSVPPPLTRVEDVDPEEPEVKRRTAREWMRWASFRGPKAAVFRQKVRAAYDSTCVVCGVRLPPTAATSPGVDAAHILPWSQFDLDHVSNGLCLCKQHHWAFDEGLLRIRYDGGQYTISLSPDLSLRLSELGQPQIMESLTSYVGVIPDSRLPLIASNRPRPEFLNRLLDDWPQ